MASNQLNIMYSSDGNYARHMGVSIFSLLENNKDFEKIRIYVIDNEISKADLSKLNESVSLFDNAEIEYISFEKQKNRLNLNMPWNISISSYARLFVGSMLPETVDKILYLDCDMIICGSLKELWSTDLGNSLLAAVQDSISTEVKNSVGVEGKSKYFNAGMILFNLEKWRKEDFEKKCLTFIESHDGNVMHHDQGVLNAVCKNQVLFLPLEYNLMTIHYMFGRSSIINYFKEEADFYSNSDIAKAKEKPKILHYTPSFTSRPWVKGCKHPLKNLYWETLNKTPWKGAKPQKNTAKWYVRLIGWKIRTMKK